MGLITTFLLIYLQLMTITYAWDNQFGGILVSTCPPQKVLYKVRSYHSNSQGDRRWKLYCRNDFATTCQWTNNFVNHYYQPIVFQCPHSSFINGAMSLHSFSDRRWAFYCCRRPNYHIAYCYYTGWVNALDKKLYFSLKKSRYIRGVISIYSHKHRDRRFRFQVCQLKKNK